MDLTEQHKLDCLARWMLKNMTRQEIQEWLGKQDNEEIMRDKLNQAMHERRDQTNGH